MSRNYEKNESVKCKGFMDLLYLYRYGKQTGKLAKAG